MRREQIVIARHPKDGGEGRVWLRRESTKELCGSSTAVTVVVTQVYTHDNTAQHSPHMHVHT